MNKILFISCFFISISIIGQNKYTYKRGLKFLSKSERYYSKKDFEKSLFFIEKYEKSRLGYCGNALIVAKNKINKYKLNNYIGLHKYDEALNLIDLQEEFNHFEFQKNDSLKVEILFLKFGKDKVKKAFIEAENINSKNESFGIYNYQIKLNDLNYDFNFKVYKNKLSKALFTKNSFKNFYFISYGQSFHRLIFDNESNSKEVEFSSITKDGNNLRINYTSNVNKEQYDKLPTNQNFLVQDILDQTTKIINSNTNQHFFSTTKRENKIISQSDFFIKTYIYFENNSPKKFKIEKIIYYNDGKINSNIFIEFNKDDYKNKKLDLEFEKVSFSKIELDKIISEIYERSPFIVIKK